MARLLGVLTIAVTILSGPIGAQPASTQEADEAAIRGVIVEMTDAFNQHDARAATRMYAAQGDFVSVRGETAKDAADVEAKLAAIFRTRAREATLKTLDVRIRFVRPDVALAHVTNELSGLVAPDGQRQAPHQELSLRVFVKSGDQWQIAAFHNTMIRPFEAAAR